MSTTVIEQQRPHTGAARNIREEAVDTGRGSCFHCGEPVPADLDVSVSIGGHRRAMCCVGCEAAALAITGFGLEEYYRVREAQAPRPSTDEAHGAALAVYDDAALLAQVAPASDGVRRVSLALTGLSCAACAWLVERRVGALPGIRTCDVNLANGRAEVTWQQDDIALSRVLAAIETLGFGARPFTPDAGRQAQREAAQTLLRQFGVAAVFGMQVMMIALALYFGSEADGGGTREFLRYVSLLLTLPVVLYSARPFFSGAARILRAGAVNMDVPVSLAIALAFTGSAWHTVTGTGTVYFDSVVMFTAFLLASRYLELRARVIAGARLDGMAALVPDAATRVLDDGLETVATVHLAPGDLVLVRAGETVPADGVITSGESAVDESILSGESAPQSRGTGARVLAGSVNIDAPLTLRVNAVGERSFAGHLAQLVQRAAGARPARADVMDRVARLFVCAVLFIAAATALAWWLYDPGRWLEATLAVLVVSCPCALALARPAALAAAHGNLLARGIAVLGAGALERAARLQHVAFDKTGTLTSGRARLDHIDAADDVTREHALALAASLAQASQHPLARALRGAADSDAPPGIVEGLTSIAGRGAAATTARGSVMLGSRAWIEQALGRDAVDAFAIHDGGGKETWLVENGKVLARFEFDDRLREDAPALTAWLAKRGLVLEILSGDREAVVADVANAVGITHYSAAMTPADKLAAISAHQAAGRVVAMVGDGINDGPAMRGADVSLAVADAAAPAQQQADVLLLEGGLESIRDLLTTAAGLRRIVRQNLTWAVSYNLLALPLAMSGVLAPWAAAIGMSLSSLLVVANAMRARPAPRHAAA